MPVHSAPFVSHGLLAEHLTEPADFNGFPCRLRPETRFPGLQKGVSPLGQRRGGHPQLPAHPVFEGKPRIVCKPHLPHGDCSAWGPEKTLCQDGVGEMHKALFPGRPCHDVGLDEPGGTPLAGVESCSEAFLRGRPHPGVILPPPLNACFSFLREKIPTNPLTSPYQIRTAPSQRSPRFWHPTFLGNDRFGVDFGTSLGQLSRPLVLFIGP